MNPLASTAVAARYSPSNRTRRSAASLENPDGSSTCSNAAVFTLVGNASRCLCLIDWLLSMCRKRSIKR